MTIYSTECSGELIDYIKYNPKEIIDWVVVIRRICSGLLCVVRFKRCHSRIFRMTAVLQFVSPSLNKQSFIKKAIAC